MIIGFAVTILAGWAASGEPDLDARVLELFADTPDWLLLLARVGYSAGGLYAIGLVIVVAFRGGKRAITRDLLLAVGLFVVAAVLGGLIVSDQWPDLLPEWADPGTVAWPAARLALVTVVLQTLAPHLTLPVRRLGRRMLIVVLVSGVILGAATVTGLIGALGLGYGIAGLVHVMFGSPAGLPPTERLRTGLATIGIVDAEVEFLPEQPVGVALARAEAAGERYLLRIHGRDAADAEFVEKAWHALWYRDAGPPLSLSGIQQVEHEVVASLLAEREGASVQHVVTAGEGDENAVLVLDWPEGITVGTLPMGEITDDRLDEMWRTLEGLHAAGISHGALDLESVVLEPDGRVRLMNLGRATLSADEARTNADLVSMLATQVCAAGPDRAVASVLRTLPREDVVAMLPYLQDGVVAPELRRAAKQTAKMGDVRDAMLAELAIEEPKLASVRRIGWSDVLIIVFSIIAVNAIISQIAEIGFDVLLDELRTATLGWLVVAFILTHVSYYGDVMSLQGVMNRPVPFIPTYLLQSAKRFIGLAVPATAGRVALDVRFLQKQGVSSARALAQGPLIGVCGFIVEVGLLFLCAWRIGQEVETDDLGSINVAGLLVIVGAAVVVGIVIVMLRAEWREAVLGSIREALGSVTEVIKTPRKLLRVFGGQLFDRLFAALSLAATMAAFGVTESFASVIFVSVGTGLLAGLAPVPGGIGVAEATMTALLTAIGVPSETAFSIAITHRLVTSYLPPVLGWFSYNWLVKEGYL
ncbi:MAG: lysylphosphatidylglycerol synthase domain-containing protein [Acidimicrobiia bacterium]|nr:lysylphosphatidylglycerol synthase domain-containing protein [Acidimicrobiia bacterium]